MPSATIYYGGFIHRAEGAFGHARELKNGLERRGWDVRLVHLIAAPAGFASLGASTGP